MWGVYSWSPVSAHLHAYFFILQLNKNDILTSASISSFQNHLDHEALLNKAPLGQKLLPRRVTATGSPRRYGWSIPIHQTALCQTVNHAPLSRASTRPLGPHQKHRSQLLMCPTPPWSLHIRSTHQHLLLQLRLPDRTPLSLQDLEKGRAPKPRPLPLRFLHPLLHLW